MDKINQKGAYHYDYPKSLVKHVYYNHTHGMWHKDQKKKVNLFQLFNSIWRLPFLKDVIFQNYSRFMNIVH